MLRGPRLLTTSCLLISRHRGEGWELPRVFFFGTATFRMLENDRVRVCLSEHFMV